MEYKWLHINIVIGRICTFPVILSDISAEFHRHAVAFPRRLSSPFTSWVLGSLRHITLCEDLKSYTPSCTVNNSHIYLDQYHLGLYILLILILSCLFWTCIWNIQWRWSLYIHIFCGLLSCDSTPICKTCWACLCIPLHSWWQFRLWDFFTS